MITTLLEGTQNREAIEAKDEVMRNYRVTQDCFTTGVHRKQFANNTQCSV